tara:strand:+ start:211 stop:672 length:462 start_codon:yes stop_codon:yes gene_type:complete
MDSYPKDWNLFAFYGIFKEPYVREMQLRTNRGNINRDYKVVYADVRIDNWVKHYDYGAATIEPKDGEVLFVDVVALSPDAEKHVDFIEGVAHGWYAKRWARELFGYTWLGLNEPEIDCYVYKMNVDPELERYVNDPDYRSRWAADNCDVSSPS